MEVVPSPFEFQQFPLAHSMVLAKLSTTPTLLPEQLASLVTAVSLAARVSIRASALFVEAIMETARYSTTTGLGLTRRALISAVGSARALHASKLDWSGKGENGLLAEDAFLQVLDKYTNIGIYLIHHTFTLTELFTMSSFYLTLSTIQTGFSAAEASVRLLDSLLGSNETSRALSSIITLVKSELSEDYRFTPEERERITGGGTVGLTALTKALTAWVCLQMVTHRRSLKDMKLRVVFDCTIIKGSEGEGGGTYGKRSRGGTKQEGGKEREVEVQSSHAGNIREDEATILTDVRSELEAASRQGSYSNLQDIRTATVSTRGTTEEESQSEISNHIVEELELLCGSDSEEDQDEELPEEVRLAILEIQEHHGIVRGAGVNLEAESERGERSMMEGKGRREREEYDIDIIEETTTTTTRIRKRESRDSGKDSNFPFNSLSPLHEDFNSSNSVERMDVEEDEEDEEWVEIGSTRNSETTSRKSRDTTEEVGRVRDVEMFDMETRDIPVAFNGKRRGSLATTMRQDTIEHPEESKQRLQIVLRTMTKKFIQRKSPNPFSSSSQPNSTVSSRSVSPTRFNNSNSNSNSNPLISSSTFRKVLRSRASSPILQSENHVLNDLNQANVVLERDQSAVRNQDSQKSKNGLKSWGKVLKKTPSAGDFIVAGGGTSSSGSKLFSSSNSKSRNQKSRSDSTTPKSTSSTLTANTPTRRSNISPLSPLTPTSSALPSSSSLSTAHPTLRRTNSTKSLQTTFIETKASSAPMGEEEEPKSTNWPKRHLVENLQLFMRYSSGAYGQAFLRILGMGRHDFNYPKAHTLHVDANNHSFAHHVGVDVDDILLSSYTDTGPGFSTAKMSPIVNYVAVDHSIKSIVLSCRGSLGLSDILVDLTCSYEMIKVQHGDPKCSYFVHAGMWCSATTLQRGTVHDIIRSALESNPDYGIVLCGHSLGGGVAALLAILWSCPIASFERHSSQYTSSSGKTLIHPPLATHFVTSFASGLPPGRPISCYTFGVPCVASPDLVRYCEGLVISTVHNYDIVPTLSLGVLRDLKTMAMGLYSEGGTAEEIVGRVIGLYQRKFIADRTKPNIHIPTSTSTSTSSSSSPSSCSVLPPQESGDDDSTALGSLPEEAKEVALSASEIDDGRGKNKALDPSYRDPSLLGPEVSEDVELNDWLWSLVKTMRAGNDNEKLYPPGQVYIIENYTVFVSSETIPEGQQKYSRKEGKRVLLRAVDNVETRFSEPIFGRTMMSDHSPVGYENNIDLLFEAVIT